MKRLDVLPEAELEVTEAASHYDILDHRLGDRFIAAYDFTVRRVQQFPRAWKLIYGEYRGRKIGPFPYQVVYREFDSFIRVYAVHFMKGDPERLLRRLSKATDE